MLTQLMFEQSQKSFVRTLFISMKVLSVNGRALMALQTINSVKH